MAMKTRAQRVEMRKWYARIWWISFHVYDYGILVYAGAISPKAQGTSDFITLLVVGLTNLALYIRLQTSSPGFVMASNTAVADLEGGAKQDAGFSIEVADAAGESDSDRLVSRGRTPKDTADPPASVSTSSGNRFCDDCRLMQPMRTKHCCDCAGTCIGQQNRRYFVVYLFIQSIEAFFVLGVAASAFTMQSSIDDWLVVNMPYIVVWVSIFFTLLIAFPLFCYQFFLISTNQTSWEHARRSAITYLQHLPDDKSPFDRGLLRNWWTFLCYGDSNVWVHDSAKPQQHHSPTEDELSLM